MHEGLKVGDEFGLELVGSLLLLGGNMGAHDSSHRDSIDTRITVTDLESFHLFLKSFRDFLKVLLTIFHFAFPLCQSVCGCM